jgi:hypothetical protein
MMLLGSIYIVLYLMLYYMKPLGHRFDIVILIGKDDLAEIEKLKKIISFVYIASKRIGHYFDICVSLDFKMNSGHWKGEDIVLFKTKYDSDRKPDSILSGLDDDIGDNPASVTAVRHKNAKFGHYLYALLYGIIDKRHNTRIRQTLAWFFTLRLTENAKYVRPSSSTIDLDSYCLDLVSKLQGITGGDLLKDYAIGHTPTRRVDHQKILKG